MPKAKATSSYKFLEHGSEHKHTPQELRAECIQISREIEHLKAQTEWKKGPGFNTLKAQAETDIKFLEGKYKEAECDKVIASTPEPLESEKTQPSPETPPAAPLSFDECFKKCKEFTSRTNEECFDSCIHHH